MITPRPVTVPPPGIALWRPDLALTAPAWPPAVPPPAGGRARHLRARVEAARSLLASIADARSTAGAVGGRGGSERERVSSTLEACCAEAELDAVIADTWRQITALMEERGLR